MDTFVRVAHIVSTRGLEGGVVCKAADALPFLLNVGQTVHFVPPSLKGPRKALVLHMVATGSETWEVNFSGIDSIDMAESIVGSYCLVSQRELPEMAPKEVPIQLLEWGVEDEMFGMLGHVVDVIETPAQTTIVIEGTHGQVLIPLVDEYVRKVNEEAKQIRVTIPESLLRLNSTAGRA